MKTRLYHTSGKLLSAVTAQPVTRQSTFHIKPGSRQAVSGVVATVFGATGQIGGQLVNRLGRIGSQVVVPFRGDGMEARALKLSGDLGAIVPVPLNVRDKETIKRALKQSNVVINCIGSHSETHNFSFDQTHISVAAAIAEAAKEAGVDRLIHFSAIGADSESPSKFFSSKGKAEIVVRNIFPEATIIRPTCVFGRKDKFLNSIANLMSVSPFVPLVENGDQVLQPVFAEDVASAVLQILSSSSSVGQDFELGGPEAYTYKELLDIISKAIGVPYQTIPVSETPAKLMTKAMDMIPAKFRLFSTEQLYQMHTNLMVSERTTAKTFQDLGITPSSMIPLLRVLLGHYRPETSNVVSMA